MQHLEKIILTTNIQIHYFQDPRLQTLKIANLQIPFLPTVNVNRQLRSFPTDYTRAKLKKKN